ncbi:uncharacterized protein STEHIDRAFT_170043 [Stereum hirsutum FP-91666 SS1]|uniref:uncharacterized protein n=1 Tax=Stereum hirsutum (strain FP-91666) TaxID=721885 RepID=UPI000444979E|nr:uncharacterized protein STEHIDRAFT_170043 [Stereum hirsutum FP-91666 SS1]EIM84316.1 hypothetical protein STEHIDRAFT_170043 [Stereum hirsutum FP-91666 SS1]
METVGGIQRWRSKGPKMWFPNTIVHVSSSEQDKVFNPGSKVLLSATDSTFFRWSTRLSPSALCYIEAVVSDASALASNNKSFVAVGDVSALEIWNVTSPLPKNLTYDTRPSRLNLMGTVNFSAEYVKEADIGWQLRVPTPRLECGGRRNTVIEVACSEEAIRKSGCRLEFLQIFSEPPLSFDMQELR